MKMKMNMFIGKRTFTSSTLTTTTFPCLIGYEDEAANSNVSTVSEDLNNELHQGTTPNWCTQLQDCLNLKALPQAKQVHTHIILSGFSPIEIFLNTKLVITYAKCGCLREARRVFDLMRERNVVSWTAMISAYSKQGHAEEALTLFCQMQQTGIQLDTFAFVSILPVCASLDALQRGKEIHQNIIRSGFESDVVVGNALVDMYVKCSSIGDAGHVFDRMPTRDVVSWTTMISGYAGSGYVDMALKLFQKMPEQNVVTWTVMVAGFARNGLVDLALEIFQKMPERDVVSWTAMIAGYAQNGCSAEALNLFQQMRQTGLPPNSKTFTSVLPACANLAALHEGKVIHGNVITSGFRDDVFVGNALTDMYAKCSNIEEARNVFDNMLRQDVVSWNAMIAGYAQNGYLTEALELFREMPERNSVAWTAMIAGYAQKGLVGNAVKLFQKMPEHSVVSWTAVIAGYVQNGHFDAAMKLFRQMQLTRLKSDSGNFACVLLACANLATLHKGKEVHANIIRSEFQSDIFVVSALVDTYAKCGCLQTARRVFDKMSRRDTTLWTAMIVGYAMHGFAIEALQLFEQMQHCGTKPDHVTFVGVLSACCHAGLVEEGWHFFDCMSQYYDIAPALEHYCCMVDLLGRAGCLSEAQDFISKMPIKPDAAVWSSLLGACKAHANIDIGERVAGCLFELEPTNAAHYVLLSNIYAATGRWDCVDKVRKTMKDRNVKKVPGCSWIEINNKVHIFLIRDR